MDESTWRLAQLLLGAAGIQITFLGTILSFFWKNMNNQFADVKVRFDKVDTRFDKVEEKLTDIDRRVCRMEGAFASKDCCMIKDDRPLKKAE